MNMKKLILMLCAVGLSGAAFAAGGEVNIVPKPLSVTLRQGTFRVTPQTEIAVEEKNAELKRAAEIFSEAVAPVVGGEMKTGKQGAIDVRIDPALEAEAYTLEVTPSGISVRGGSAQGAFYGLQSLRQMIVDGEGSVPAVRIEDKPYFGYRSTR